MKKRLEKLSARHKLIAVLFASITFLATAHIILQYININIRGEEFGSFYELTNRFDFDDEASIPTWVSQFLFLLISASSLFLAKLEKMKTKKVLWLIISGVALVGSLDEVATLHENILQFLHILFFDESIPTVLANAWIIIVPFVLLAILFFMIKAVKVLPMRTIRLFMAAIGIFITGSVLIDIVSSTETTASAFQSQGLLVAIEEILELIGLSITLYAVIDYIELKYGRKLSKAKKQLFG